MRASAIIDNNGVRCPDCGVNLKPEWDTHADPGDEWCWSCPECLEWWTIDGEPAVSGTNVPEREE